MNARVLVVEDEEPIAMLLRYNLESEGFRVSVATTAEEAAHVIADDPPDLIVLDWMLPETSGFELLRQLRSGRAGSAIPILMLTARAEEGDRVRGLAAGADDYVTKPFSLPELIARIRAILRRARPQSVSPRLVAGDIELDREAHRVTRGGREVHLGPTEFRLLEFLMTSQGRVLSRTQLLDGVWGRDVYVDERTVDVHIGRLRKALIRGREGDPIRTVRGAGYAIGERKPGS
ncbi:MAG: phosphate regulon transcriptional regulator PhoB [Hyphomicrobiaceae bacterium]